MIASAPSLVPGVTGVGVASPTGQRIIQDLISRGILPAGFGQQQQQNTLPLGGGMNNPLLLALHHVLSTAGGALAPGVGTNILSQLMGPSTQPQVIQRILGLLNGSTAPTSVLAPRSAIPIGSAAYTPALASVAPAVAAGGPSIAGALPPMIAAAISRPLVGGSSGSRVGPAQPGAGGATYANLGSIPGIIGHLARSLGIGSIGSPVPGPVSAYGGGDIGGGYGGTAVSGKGMFGGPESLGGVAGMEGLGAENDPSSGLGGGYGGGALGSGGNIE